MQAIDSTQAALIFLDDYLSSPDFPDNLLALTHPLGETLGLPRVDELGIVCADVPALVRELEAKYRQMGPFFMGKGAPTEFDDHGRTIQYETRVAFGYYRGVLIELAEPGTGSDLFRRAYDASRSTIHHLGFYARGDELERSDASVAVRFADRMHEAGYEPAWRALVGVLGFFGRVTIFDTARVTRGVDIEFLDFRAFSRNGLKISLPPWLLAFSARLERFLGHPVLNLPSSS
jgi:hypothetical protein